MSGVSGDFDVADDEPLTRARLADVLGEVVGRPVHRPPTWLVRTVLGPRMEFLLRSQRVSHTGFTAATGWTPQVRSAAEGLRRLAGAAMTGAGMTGAAVSPAAGPARAPGRPGRGS
jgi:NAD dependent epimerase/dehydratase family enzyme